MTLSNSVAGTSMFANAIHSSTYNYIIYVGKKQGKKMAKVIY